MPFRFENQPLMVDGVLYVTTPYNNAAALDAETGKELWRFDGGAVKLGGIPGTGFKHRAPALWRDAQDGNKLRVLLNTRNQLFSLDAQTGKPVASFGDDGVVSLTDALPAADLRRPPRQPRRVAAGRLPRHRRRRQLDSRSIPDERRASGHRPGIRCAHGEAAVGLERDPAIADRLRRRRRGRKGRGGSPATPTSGGRWRSTRRAACSTSAPARPATTTTAAGVSGKNEPAESIVCLDITTGQRKWSFQMVHHGLWDFDNPAAPNLVTITVDGKRIDAVAQVTKQAFTYVFDRVTGEPVWPIVERAGADRHRRARREGVADAAVSDQAAAVRAAGRLAGGCERSDARQSRSWRRPR